MWADISMHLIVYTSTFSFAMKESWSCGISIVLHTTSTWFLNTNLSSKGPGLLGEMTDFWGGEESTNKPEISCLAKSKRIV